MGKYCKYLVLIFLGFDFNLGQGQSLDLNPPPARNDTNALHVNVDVSRPKHIYSFEWGTLFHARLMAQVEGNFRLDGQNSGIHSGLKFYALQSFQKPFQGSQGTFDQANSYYFSHTNAATGGTYYLGFTHDKAQTSDPDRKYRYNKGGMEITAMRGKVGFSKFKFLLGKLYYEYRGGIFISLNDIRATIGDSSWGYTTYVESTNPGRAFAGMGLIAGATGGISWRVYHSFSISLGLSMTAMAGYSRTTVMVDGTEGHRLSVRYANLFPTAPVLKFSF